jgi:L-asparaginase II
MTKETTNNVPQAAPLVEVRRGAITESRHRGHVVAVDGDGVIVARLGTPETVTFMRSSAKPLQAVPLLTSGAAERFRLDERELALACASHSGQDLHAETVAGMLRKIGLDESYLKCGVHEPFDRETAERLRARGESPGVLRNNCSGKHAGFIALCKAEGWPVEGYRLPEHACQHAMRDEISVAAMVDPDGIATAVDGCGVVTFALPLARMAHAFSRLVLSEGGTRIAQAMRAHPELIRGLGSADTELMRTQPGWIAKGGAEGILCAASPEGLGIALKVEDGAWRAVRSAAAALLGRLALDPRDLGVVPLENSRGEVVGEFRAV